jgi:hypothetical protein
MTNKERFNILLKIAKRADKMNLLTFNRLSLMTDITFAAEQFNIQLNDILTANDCDFSYDIVGIQNNINKKTKRMENMFIPRYATI